MSLEQPRLPNRLDDIQKPIASRKPGKDSREQARLSIASYTTCAEQLPDVFTDMDDQCAMEETAVMNAQEATIETPKLPERSALRASRFIEALKLDTIEPPTDPHDVYLSSEEDASSSSNDFSDYEGDYDSDSDYSQDSPVRRASKEVTARAVSVIFIGRPCVVDLASGRRSVSPVRRPRSRSSSSSSRTNSFDSPASHPPRKSSLASTVDLSKENSSFLDQDPFAVGNYKLESAPKEVTPTDASPRVPKTPTRAFHRFQKSLSLVRKRSRPNLKDASCRDSMTWSPVSTSTTDLSSSPDTSRASEEQPQQPTRSGTEPVSAVTTPPRTSVTYNEIMMRARRESAPRLLTKLPPAQPTSPSPISGKRGLLSGLSMNRRRSMRIKP